MRFYRSNKIVEPQQRTPIEEKSTKRDLLSTDLPTTNNQMSNQSIQTDVVFSSKAQVTGGHAKSLVDINLVMKPTSPIPKPKKEKPKLVHICNQGEFFVEPKRIKQSLTLEKFLQPLKFPRKLTNHYKVQRSWARQTF